MYLFLNKHLEGRSRLQQISKALFAVLRDQLRPQAQAKSIYHEIRYEGLLAQVRQIKEVDWIVNVENKILTVLANPEAKRGFYFFVELCGPVVEVRVCGPRVSAALAEEASTHFKCLAAFFSEDSSYLGSEVLVRLDFEEAIEDSVHFEGVLHTIEAIFDMAALQSDSEILH